MAISEVTDQQNPDRGELAETLRPLREATHLPSYIYTSKELFEREKEEIFMKDWLAVARVEEIEKPGDYMTFHIMGEPIVVVRDRDVRSDVPGSWRVISPKFGQVVFGPTPQVVL